MPLLLRTCLPLAIAAALCLPNPPAGAQPPAQPAPAPKAKHGPTPPPIACAPKRLVGLDAGQTESINFWLKGQGQPGLVASVEFSCKLDRTRIVVGLVHAPADKEKGEPSKYTVHVLDLSLDPPPARLLRSNAITAPVVIVRPGGGVISWAAIYPLALALFFALYQITTRLVSRGDAPMVTLAWTIAVGLVLTTPLLPFAWRPVSGNGWLLLILSGIFFGLSHLVLIRAFSMAPAAVLTPFTYAQIIAATLLGVVVFGDVPDAWAVAGMALIALAGLYVLRRQASENPATAPAQL